MGGVINAYLDAAEAAYAVDDFERARHCYTKVLEHSPDHALAMRALTELDSQLGEALASEAPVILAVPLSELVLRDVPGREAFILSRLAAGPLTVDDLSRQSRTEPPVLRAMISRWLSRGLVAIGAG